MPGPGTAVPPSVLDGSAERAAALIDRIRPVALEAGAAILEIYEAGFDVRHKGDRTPVTDADQSAERIILRGLQAIAPGVPVVAEEAMEAGDAPDISGGLFFLVDPLDGTRDFVARTGEFTVNIGLVRDGRPVLGLIHVPALAETYWATPQGGAWRRRGPDAAEEAIRCRPAPSADGLDVVASRMHGRSRVDDFLRRLPVRSRINAGSALKFCRVAEGVADLYPRFGPTMEWDTAAGHAILAAAGGSVTDEAGRPLTYGKPGFRNPFFIARGPGVP